MNKKLLSVILAVMLLISSVTLYSAFAKSEIGNNTVFTKTENGVTLTVLTNKTEYKPGEQTVILISVKNNTDNDIHYFRWHFNDFIAIDTMIKYDDTKKFECENDYVDRLPSGAHRTIAPGETLKLPFIFTGNYYDENGKSLPVEAGEYTGRATFEYSFSEIGDNDQSISLDFTVKYVDNPSGANNDFYINSVEKNGIKLSAYTNKASYFEGEPIRLSVTAENNTDADIYIYRDKTYYRYIFEFGSVPAKFFKADVEGGTFDLSCELKREGESITTLKPGESITEIFRFTKDDSDGFSFDITFSYLIEEKYAENDHHVTLSLDNTMLSDPDNSSSSGNAQPADVQLEVTEVGSVGESLVMDDTTKLYATIRNNGSEAGEAKVTVNFSVAGQTVDTQTYEVNLKPGKSTVVTSTKDWTADIGTWAVRADISQDGKNDSAGQKYIKARISVAD